MESMLLNIVVEFISESSFVELMSKASIVEWRKGKTVAELL